MHLVRGLTSTFTFTSLRGSVFSSLPYTQEVNTDTSKPTAVQDIWVKMQKWVAPLALSAFYKNVKITSKCLESGMKVLCIEAPSTTCTAHSLLQWISGLLCKEGWPLLYPQLSCLLFSRVLDTMEEGKFETAAVFESMKLRYILITLNYVFWAMTKTLSEKSVCE